MGFKDIGELSRYYNAQMRKEQARQKAACDADARRKKIIQRDRETGKK